MKKIIMMITAAMFVANMMASEPIVESKIVDRMDSTLAVNNVKHLFGLNNCYATLEFNFTGNPKPFKFDVYEKVVKGRTTYLLGKGENNVNVLRIKNNIIYMPIGTHRMLVIKDKNFASKFENILEPIEESTRRF